MFGAERAGTEHAQLVQAEQNDQHAADARKQRAVIGEKAAQRRKPQPQRKKGKADAQHKKHRIAHYTAAFVAHCAVGVHTFRAARQIPDVQWYQRQHARGKEA